MKSNQGTPYIERQTFVWSGIGPVGDFQRGTIDAININIASNEIESNGVAVKTISLNKTRQAKNLLSTRISMRGNSIKPRNTAIFIRQLATLMFVHHVTWSINSFCHVFGKRPFRSRDLASNVNWLAIPSFGES